MTKKMKAGDIVQSPEGLIQMIAFHKNGTCTFNRLYPAISKTGVSHSRIVRTYPIIERPKAIKPPKRKPLYGQGVIGEGKYRSVEDGVPTMAYRAWRGMLQRVYAPQDKATAETYGDVEVCEKWLNFQNYAEWYYAQLEQYPDWRTVPFKWVVDKDLLIPQNRTYCPEACCVIPQPINSTMTFRRASKRKNGMNLPLGVSPSDRDGWDFCAYGSSFDRGNVFLGFYATVRQAQVAYWEYKFKAIRYTALHFGKYIPKAVGDRMLNFGFDDVALYYGSDPYIWGTHGLSLGVDKKVVMREKPSLIPGYEWVVEPTGQTDYYGKAVLHHICYIVYPDGTRKPATPV